MTSYKVMVSNDSHTWVTVKNGSGDMVSFMFPPSTPLVSSYVGLCKERGCVPPRCLLILCQLKPVLDNVPHPLLPSPEVQCQVAL